MMNTVNASDTVLGLIVYTGKDTKAVMNTSSASTKTGLLDLEINRLAKVEIELTIKDIIRCNTCFVIDDGSPRWIQAALVCLHAPFFNFVFINHPY